MTFDPVNFTIAAPLLALAAGALVILLLDLLLNPQQTHGLWHAVGIGSVLVSGYYLWGIWGDKASGFDGALVMDPFAQVFSLVLLTATLLALLLSAGRSEEDKSGYLALLLWGSMGMMTMAAAGNLMTIFLGIELLSLALYVAVAFDGKLPNAREAAFKYFVLGSVASAFILFGFAMIYGVTGTMTLPGIAKAAVPGALYYKIGIGLSLVGFAFKLALAPFHTWAPDVYQGATTAVTAYMAVGTKAAAFAATARFLVAAVPAAAAGSYLFPVAVLAVISMILGSTVGIWQTDLKRMMAYSGIAHAGYLIMAIPGLGTEGLSAAAYYLAAYCFTAMGVFGIVALLESEGEEGAKFSVLEGLFYRRPWLGVAMALFMFANAGLPPTGAFIGKFLLAKAAVGANAWMLLIALMVSTGISAYVYLRVIGVCFRKPVSASAAERRARMAGAQADLSMSSGAVRFALISVLVIAAVGTLWLGVVPGGVISLLQATIAL